MRTAHTNARCEPLPSGEGEEEGEQALDEACEGDHDTGSSSDDGDNDAGAMDLDVGLLTALKSDCNRCAQQMQQWLRWICGASMLICVSLLVWGMSQSSSEVSDRPSPMPPSTSILRQHASAMPLAMPPFPYLQRRAWPPLAPVPPAASSFVVLGSTSPPPVPIFRFRQAPSRPPPAAPLESVVDRINSRYNNFVPGSSRLEDIGVIVHGIDFTEDPKRPWAVCSPDSSDCGFLSDRMSASVIWKVKGTAAFGGGGGVVLNPKHSRVLCIYGGDGGTRGKTCNPPGATDSCIPGCVASSRDEWCDGHGARNSWCDGKPWRPSQLGTFLQLDGGMTTYNEAIIDGFYWNANLPHSIEALIGSPNDPGAVKLHERFLSTYRLTKNDVPLLIFEKERGNCPFKPFEQALPQNTNEIDIRLDYKVDGQWAKWTAPKPEAMPETQHGPPDADVCYYGPYADAAPPPPESPVIDLRTAELPALVLGRS